MLVSDGDWKDPSDKLGSSLRSRESSDSGFRMFVLKIGTHHLTVLTIRVIVLLEQDEHLRRKAYEYQ